MSKVLGADLSMNHGAVVLLEKGKLAGLWYYTDIVGSAARADTGTRWKAPKTKDPHIKQMMRLAFFNWWFREIALACKPEYVGIEDYALDAGRNAQHTGEVGGAARLAAYDAGACLRLHDPTSVKMFTAYHGHADKEMMEKAVATRWGETFGEYNGKPMKGKKAKRQTSEDICDAFAIAQMVWTELQLKRGEVLLKDLHEKEIQVFNRVTKFMPMNLLDRDFVVNDEAAGVLHEIPTKKLALPNPEGKWEALPGGPCSECGALTTQNPDHQEDCKLDPDNRPELLTPERVEGIIDESMRGKADLRRYLNGGVTTGELTPKSTKKTPANLRKRRR